MKCHFCGKEMQHIGGMIGFCPCAKIRITHKPEILIEQLNSKKGLLLTNRNKIFNSFGYRFFSLGRNKITELDKELDKIEEEIYCLRKPELQKEILLAKNLIEKTNKNISKYKHDSWTVTLNAKTHATDQPDLANAED